MGYLRREKDSDNYEFIEDITKFKKGDFKKYDLFYTSKITPDNYADQVRQHRRMELTLQMEKNMKELHELGGPVSSNPPPPPPNLGIPGLVSHSNPNPAALAIVNQVNGKEPVKLTRGPINPSTGKEYTRQEVDAAHERFESIINNDNEEKFEHVAMIENNGDHFIVQVNEKKAGFPTTFAGIPLVQQMMSGI